MTLVLAPRFPDRRPRPDAPEQGVAYARTGRAAKRRAQLARKCERAEGLADVLADAGRILTASSSVRDAVGEVMRATIAGLHVDFAAMWCEDPRTRVLRCAVGAVARPDFEEFCVASRARDFDPGIGLPGRVWTSGAAAWIPDLERDDNFPRAPVALGTGLRSGIAVPVRRMGRVIGAVELFTAQAAAPDFEFLRRLGALGDLIGLFLDPEALSLGSTP